MVVLSWIVCLMSLGTSIYAETQLRMNILGHSPCGKSVGTANPLIEFPSSKQSKVHQNRWKPWCYTITEGKVEVSSPGLHGKVEMLTTLQFGASSPKEECKNSDRWGCGGVGSCRYCDVCAGINNLNRKNGNLLSILQRGNKIDCQVGLRPGSYSDVTIEVCLPTKDQMLQMLHPNPTEAQKLWNIFKQKNGVPLILFSRLYKVPNREQWVRSQPKHSDMVGCHWLYGKVYEVYN